MLDALFSIFVIIIGVQLLFAMLFLPFTLSKPYLPSKIPALPVSVVIAAQNEAKNLGKFLPLVLRQNYPDFEVIVVNDASTDNTKAVLLEMQRSHPHLKVVHHYPTDSYSGNKKKAISRGIAKAKNEHLIFTDADCEPASEVWLAAMANGFTQVKKIVLGYGKYRKIPGSFLNKLIRFETLLTAIQYFSYAKAGMPYMGVGRNLGYTKTLFGENGKFHDHGHIRSGDDDLFVNAMANGQNTALCFAPKSFTISEPKKSYRGWFRQKRRHISTASRYKPLHKLLLGVFYLSQAFFYLLAIILFMSSFNLYWLILLVLVRFLTIGSIYAINAKKLRETDLIVLFFILEPVLILDQFIFFVNNLIRKPNFW